MEKEQGEQGKEDSNWRFEPQFFMEMMQSMAQNYELAATEQELSRLIEKSVNEVAKHPETRLSDPYLFLLYFALPALIRSRDALQDFQQLQANASRMGLDELRYSLNTLQQKPFERVQQSYQTPQEDVVLQKRNLGEIWLEMVAPLTPDAIEVSERSVISLYIQRAGTLLQRQITPSYRRSNMTQQIIYLLCDPRLFELHPGETYSQNYGGIYMLNNSQQPPNHDTFPQGVRYVGRTSNLRRRMKLHLANGHDSGTATKRAWIAELSDEQLYPMIIIAERTEETTRLAEEREYRWILQSLRLGASLTNVEASYKHLAQMCQTSATESFLSEPFDLETPSSILWQILEAYGRDLRDRDSQKRKRNMSPSP